MGCMVNKSSADELDHSDIITPCMSVAALKIHKRAPLMYRYNCNLNLGTIKEVATLLESSRSFEMQKRIEPSQ